MPELIVIDASKARSDFFNLLLRAYKGEAFLIKKSGIPVAKIARPDLDNVSNILKFAGAFKDIDDRKMVKNIYHRRRDSLNLKRNLPKL